MGRDPAATWVLDRFWQRSTGKAPLPQPPAAAPARSGEETSRYLSDFQVLGLKLYRKSIRHHVPQGSFLSLITASGHEDELLI